MVILAQSFRPTFLPVDKSVDGLDHFRDATQKVQAKESPLEICIMAGFAVQRRIGRF